ncbi:hypothetical protein WJX81_004761 [Elliptochloris bilobata]|uniref:Autophagy-related protein 9 n=1 Tax=Elliptochloris bilobata TaxID=381761 RepID=A0AAW1SGM0_9CHLO
MRPGRSDGDAEFAYDALPSLPEAEDGPGEWDAPQPLLSNEESTEWDAIPNLDDFFRRIYKYYEEKGFQVILVSRVLNLLALGFTVAFSAVLLLFVRWDALRASCILDDICDISEAVINRHPLAGGLTLWKALCLTYLAIFGAYWLYNLVHLAVDLREAANIRHFMRNRLGLSEHQLRCVSWPEVARRIVEAQKTTRLCIVRDLTEADVVARIMRKENYLIGLLNRGVLALHVPVPGLRKRLMLTKTLEWNLHWCVLDAMLDDKSFTIRESFVADVAGLQRRFRRMAVVNLVLAPFLLAFLLIYFFMRNAERLYHQPSAAGARRWSPLAAWRLREFNELPHYTAHRLNASHKAAERYIAQFPSAALNHAARFVAFVAGSFAALLLFAALVDDVLLERHLFGRTIVWWGAVLGVVLAVSRAFIVEAGMACEPELALLEVVAHTHWLPRHWRGRAHTREVQGQFEQLFQYKALMFVEELASVVLTPFVLYVSLPKCVPAILAFVRDFTLHVDGVGDICSLAAFDLQRHGNAKYGAPVQAPKAARSRQGKMEKSLLSFAATYPTWEPDAAAKQLLATLAAPGSAGAPGPHFPYTSHVPEARSARLGPHLFLGPSRSGAPAAPYAAAAVSSLARLAARAGGGGSALYGSIFASADLALGASALELAASPAVNAEERVATGQLLLQSFYEERERQLRLHGAHHVADPPRRDPLRDPPASELAFVMRDPASAGGSDATADWI